MKLLFKRVVGRLKRIAHEFLPRFFVSNYFMSSLYYLVFSNRFKREQHAVLKGKVQHLKESRENNASFFTLIRNTHRIEKGLLMKPRRPIFGLDYIGETVEAFIRIWEYEKMKTDDQYKWFLDVLQEYFRTTGSHPKIDVYQKKFNDFLNRSDATINTNKSKSIPYHRLEEHKPNISFEDFYRLTRYRRSVRWFLDKKVPQELINKALLAAGQSPSACNRQPFEYIVINEPELLKNVLQLPMGVKGYADNIPMLVIAVGNLTAYFDERDRHLIYIDASLANMSFMLALETLGLSSCPINWPDVEHLEKRMEKLLKLKKFQRPIMCIAVGYPDSEGKVAYSEKRNIDTLKKVLQ